MRQGLFVVILFLAAACAGPMREAELLSVPEWRGTRPAFLSEQETDCDAEFARTWLLQPPPCDPSVLDPWRSMSSRRAPLRPERSFRQSRLRESDTTIEEELAAPAP
ncbi:MAG: hypothetical protein AAB974_02990 [Patescibacteria group bacterium]